MDGYFYVLKLKEVYTGEEDIKQGMEVTIDDEAYTFMGLLDRDSPGEIVENVTDATSKFVLGVKEFKENFDHNAPGTIFTILLDLLRTLIDGIQIIINTIQTSTLHTLWDFRLAYSYDYLVSDREAGEEMENVDPESNRYDNSAGNRDIYTNVSEFMGEAYVTDEERQKYIYINGDTYAFDSSTEIPVIPIDIYNLGVGDIGFLDINFFTGDETHEEGSPWMTLRNIASTIMHITLYLAAAFLILTLIWNGIHIVRGSLDTPEKQAERKKGIQRFFTSLLMLVGSIVVMALCIFASDMLVQDLKAEDHELPIRVNVSFSSDSEMTGYSFSTNFTGYVRYMTQIQDVDMAAQKAVYVLEYLALVIVNVIGGVFMLLRMVVMLFLAILGPIVAAMNALNREGNTVLNFKTWAELYIALAAVQIFLAIAARIILECSIFN